MTNYTTLRVTDLKDLLTKRKLPTNGNKAELISRLEAADRESTASTTPVVAPEASTTAHLPSAEEYEINWDEDETTSTGGPKSAKLPPAKPESTEVKKAVAPSGASATTATASSATPPVTSSEAPTSEKADGSGKKSFTFKRLADQFTDLPSTKKPDTKKSGTPAAANPTATATAPAAEAKADAPATAAAPAPAAAPEPSFAANLPPTPLESELERRKARAARFGAEALDPVAIDSLKKLERAARFGGATADSATDKPIGVKGLDQALPEHTRKGKRANDHGGNVAGRGGIQKRPRHGDRGQQVGRGRGPIVGSGERKATVVTGTQRRAGNPSGSRSVLDDPTEREKAEKRKNRFGA